MVDENEVLAQRQYQFTLSQALEASKREYLATSSSPGDPGYDTLAGLQNLAGLVKQLAFNQAAARAGMTGDLAFNFESGADSRLQADQVYKALCEEADAAIPQSVIEAANAGVGIEDPVEIAQLKVDRETAKVTLLMQFVSLL